MNKSNGMIFGIEESASPKIGLDQALARLQSDYDNGKLRASGEIAKAAYSAESLGPSSSLSGEASTLFGNVASSLESAFNHGFGFADEKGQVPNVQQTVAGKQAAAAAAILAGSIGQYITSEPHVSRGSMEGIPLLKGVGLTDAVSKRQYSAEAYDNKELRDMTVYSILYNQKHGSQDEFAEAWFPTVTVSPDQAGYTVTMNVMTVMNEVRRDISGDETDFGRKNLIHAIIDPTILDNNQTRLTPVFRPESKQNFVDEADLPTKTVKIMDEDIPTSALKFSGKPIDLLGISQTESLLETGILDSTDSIDSGVYLDELIMKTSGEVFRLRVRHLPESNFYPAVQGNYRQLRVYFETKAVLIGGPGKESIKTVKGTDSVALKPIVDNKLAVRLGMVISGQVNTETGSLTLSGSTPVVARINDEDGNELAASDATYQTIAALFEDAELLGYTIDAYRCNANRRSRGQLIDTTYQSQMYQPQLRSPVTIPRPETNVEQTDSADIAALMVHTGIRTTNAAIDQIFIAEQVLRDHFNPADPIAATPTLMGVALGPIRPFYEEHTIDVEKEINSLKSHEKVLDMQAVLINRLRDVAYRAWRETGYKPVADALAGGIAKKPTVLIGTDPVIANYLITPGDVRTFGAEMDYKIVYTYNKRVRDTIFLTFMNPDAAKSGVPDPLTFGNMGWKPELVIALPTYFNGANSRQITVQPCFIHSINCPILARFNVKNLDKVTQVRTPVSTEEVAP